MVRARTNYLGDLFGKVKDDILMFRGIPWPELPPNTTKFRCDQYAYNVAVVVDGFCGYYLQPFVRAQNYFGYCVLTFSYHYLSFYVLLQSSYLLDGFFRINRFYTLSAKYQSYVLREVLKMFLW